MNLYMVSVWRGNVQVMWISDACMHAGKVQIIKVINNNIIVQKSTIKWSSTHSYNCLRMHAGTLLIIIKPGLYGVALTIDGHLLGRVLFAYVGMHACGSLINGMIILINIELDHVISLYFEGASGDTSSCIFQVSGYNHDFFFSSQVDAINKIEIPFSF